MKEENNGRMATMDYKIVHLGHLGVGGAFGIAPDGNELNREQAWIREAWNNSKQSVGIPSHYPEMIILGGEVIEGTNPKNGGENISSAWLMNQIDDAVSCIQEWVGEETQEILLCYAHGYHGAQNFRIEDIVADKLKIIFPGKNIQAGTYFDRTRFGKVLRFIHGKNGAITYLSSANERTLKFNLQQAGLGKTHKVDQIYEYHGHRVAGAIFEQVGSLWCPCFKLMDISGQMQNPDGWRPDIGIMITTFEERFGETRICNDTLLYVSPFEYTDLELERVRFNKNCIKMNMMNTLPLSPQTLCPVKVREGLETIKPLLISSEIEAELRTISPSSRQAKLKGELSILEPQSSRA